MQNRLVTFLLLVGVVTLVACSALSLDERRATSSRLATETGWLRHDLNSGPFVLVAFTPPGLQHSDRLTIYIEGDGLAWINSSTPSLDPTPLNPLALLLAVRDPSGHAVYLARPCQYVLASDRRGCENKYWTSHRFAPEVIEASNHAVNALKALYGASKLRLVGYSGGGAIAALLAARRDDVDFLVTIAGNLDHEAWTKLHHASPMTASLNPANEWAALQKIPQVHLVGGQDNNITQAVSLSYQIRFPELQRPTLIVIDDFDHNCCWVEQWQQLYKRLQLENGF